MWLVVSSGAVDVVVVLPLVVVLVVAQPLAVPPNALLELSFRRLGLVESYANHSTNAFASSSDGGMEYLSNRSHRHLSKRAVR